jgi:hypothetical protein
MSGQLDVRNDGVWCRLSAESYDAAVYGSPLLGPVLDTELAMARRLLGKETVLVESGIDSFYRRNPRLCGNLAEARVDLIRRELFVPATGYYSHWFSEEELSSLAGEAGVRNARVVADGIALFLVGDGWTSSASTPDEVGAPVGPDELAYRRPESDGPLSGSGGCQESLDLNR